MWYLGICYQSGIDDILEQDYEKAFSLFEQAAKLGVYNAHERLGRMYYDGEGVERDEAKGMYHCTIAYGQGSCSESSYIMGLIFGGCRGCNPKSFVRAKHYLEVSCVEHGNEDAYYAFEYVLLDLCREQYEGRVFIPGHSCIPKALYWYRKAVALPNAHAAETKEYKRLESCVMSQCAYCWKTADELPGKLKACSLCKAAYYCGKQCQADHWKAGHKIDCIRRNYPQRAATAEM